MIIVIDNDYYWKLLILFEYMMQSESTESD